MNDQEIQEMLNEDKPVEAIAAAVKNIQSLHESELATIKAHSNTVMDEKKDLSRRFKELENGQKSTTQESQSEIGKLTNIVNDLNAKIEAGQKLIAVKEEQSMENFAASEIEKAIANNNGISQALSHLVRSMVKVVDNNGHYGIDVLDSEGRPRINNKGGALTVNDLLSEMKTSGEVDWGFKAQTKSGGGATNTNGGANGAKKSVTSTQFKSMPPADQMDISRKVKKGEVEITES